MMPIKGGDPGWLQVIDGLTADRTLRVDLQARTRLRASDEVKLCALYEGTVPYLAGNEPSTPQYIRSQHNFVLGVHGSAADAQYCT